MTTLHIENTVHDYDEWKAVFDKFERFRTDHGVRSYRVSRLADDPQRVNVDLDFATADAAVEFRGELEKIRRTPQSQAQLIAQAAPQLFEVVEQRSL
ncbi:hypothetical protein [Nocardioides speluncae]|uniref:hypothetical protein n=1 Tax=Nocardioides speluncae TaxID=2670337 RepID=UPI0012B1865E|nr:hypothetical protein [Nocardioides speluncae]